ncbi:phospholipase [Rossellomorea oryzaecorticis]|uniref:Phospholipase n=1 Tax=Rossellomorea oryzaecorticis TaxID=1396505 RepID=A0ABW8VLR0_9BACI
MGQRGRRGYCIPGYKWCGLGCSGPGQPVNEIDAVCMEHDLCYEEHGPACHCDREFLSRLKPHINLDSREGRDAFIFYHYMKFQSSVKCGQERRGCNRGMRWI